MKALRKKNNEQARKLWMQAYKDGCVTIDYSQEIGAKELTTKMHYFLRNFRTYHKRYPFKEPALLEIMECCSLRKIDETIIQIERKRLSSKAIGTNVLLTSAPIEKKLTMTERHEKVLKLFKQKSLSYLATAEDV